MLEFSGACHMKNSSVCTAEIEAKQANHKCSDIARITLRLRLSSYFSSKKNRRLFEHKIKHHYQITSYQNAIKVFDHNVFKTDGFCTLNTYLSPVSYVLILFWSLFMFHFRAFPSKRAASPEPVQSSVFFVMFSLYCIIETIESVSHVFGCP